MTKAHPKGALPPKLLEGGFRYRVLKDIGDLQAGAVIEVMHALYASSKEEGGYIIWHTKGFIRLHREDDRQTIDHIDDYLARGEAFDDDAELKKTRAAAERDEVEWRDSIDAHNHDAQQRIQQIMNEQSVDAKTAYRLWLKMAGK